MHLSVEAQQKEPGVWELKVEVPVAEVQRVTQAVYRQLNKSLRVPGFRPGRVPLGVIKRIVGEDRFNRHVLEALLPDALGVALQRQKLEPIVLPEWRDIRFTEGEPLRFIAEVITRPDVHLGEYKGLSLKRIPATVTEEMLQEALEEVRKDLASYEATEEPARQGDRVRVRYQVLREGEKPKDEWQSGTFPAGAEGWVPPLPQHLLGRRVGDEGEFPFTYPQEHRDPALAGQKVQVRFVIEGVLRQKLPELTDEIVQRELGLDGVEALKEELRRELQVRARRMARAAERKQAEEALLECCSVRLPKALVERFTNELLAETERELQGQGWTLTTWLQQQGKSLDEYRDDLRKEAERTLKLRFILEAIAEKEGIAITEEEVRQAAGDEGNLTEEQKTRLRRRLLEERVMDLILTAARWQEEEPSGERV